MRCGCAACRAARSALLILPRFSGSPCSPCSCSSTSISSYSSSGNSSSPIETSLSSPPPCVTGFLRFWAGVSSASFSFFAGALPLPLGAAPLLLNLPAGLPAGLFFFQPSENLADLVGGALEAESARRF